MEGGEHDTTVKPHAVQPLSAIDQAGALHKQVFQCARGVAAGGGPAVATPVATPVSLKHVSSKSS